MTFILPVVVVLLVSAPHYAPVHPEANLVADLIRDVQMLIHCVTYGCPILPPICPPGGASCVA